MVNITVRGLVNSVIWCNSYLYAHYLHAYIASFECYDYLLQLLRFLLEQGGGPNRPANPFIIIRLWF